MRTSSRHFVEGVEDGLVLSLAHFRSPFCNGPKRWSGDYGRLSWAPEVRSQQECVLANQITQQLISSMLCIHSHLWRSHLPSSIDGRSEHPKIGRKATFGRSEQCYSGSIRNTRLREAHRSGRGDFGLLKGRGQVRLSASSVFPFIFDNLRRHLQVIEGTDCSVSASRSPIVHLAKARTWGLLSVRLRKEGLPRYRNTQHVAPPSCLYKFHTSLFPPVLRNRNRLPGPRKSTIVARPVTTFSGHCKMAAGGGLGTTRSSLVSFPAHFRPATRLGLVSLPWPCHFVKDFRAFNRMAAGSGLGTRLITGALGVRPSMVFLDV